MLSLLHLTQKIGKKPEMKKKKEILDEAQRGGGGGSPRR